MNIEKVKIIKEYSIKSNEKLKASKELLKSCLYNDSASRSYYSVFTML